MSTCPRWTHQAPREGAGNTRDGGLPFLFVLGYDDPHTQGAVKTRGATGSSAKGRPVSLLREWVKFLLTPYSRRNRPPPGEGERDVSTIGKTDVDGVAPAAALSNRSFPTTQNTRSPYD